MPPDVTFKTKPQIALDQIEWACAAGLPRGDVIVDVARGFEYVKAADEHGVLAVAADREPLQPGDRVWLIPGHCDPTVNLYDWIVGVRGTRVECLWPVAARGAMG